MEPDQTSIKSRAVQPNQMVEDKNFARNPFGKMTEHQYYPSDSGIDLAERHLIFVAKIKDNWIYFRGIRFRRFRGLSRTQGERVGIHMKEANLVVCYIFIRAGNFHLHCLAPSVVYPHCFDVGHDINVSGHMFTLARCG